MASDTPADDELLGAMNAALDGAMRRRKLLATCVRTPSESGPMKRMLQKDSLSSASTASTKVTPDAKRLQMSEVSPAQPRDLFPETTPSVNGAADARPTGSETEPMIVDTPSPAPKPALPAVPPLPKVGAGGWVNCPQEVATSLQQLLDNPVLKANPQCLGDLLQRVVDGHLGGLGVQHPVEIASPGAAVAAEPVPLKPGTNNQALPALSEHQQVPYKNYWEKFRRPSAENVAVAKPPSVGETLLDSDVPADQFERDLAAALHNSELDTLPGVDHTGIPSDPFLDSLDIDPMEKQVLLEAQAAAAAAASTPVPSTPPVLGSAPPLGTSALGSTTAPAEAAASTPVASTPPLLGSAPPLGTSALGSTPAPVLGSAPPLGTSALGSTPAPAEAAALTTVALTQPLPGSAPPLGTSALGSTPAPALGASTVGSTTAPAEAAASTPVPSTPPVLGSAPPLGTSALGSTPAPAEAAASTPVATTPPVLGSLGSTPAPAAASAPGPALPPPPGLTEVKQEMPREAPGDTQMLMRVDQVTEALNRKNTIDMPGGNQSQAPPGLPNPPNTGGGHAADEDDDVDALRALKNAYMRMYRSIKSDKCPPEIVAKYKEIASKGKKASQKERWLLFEEFAQSGEDWGQSQMVASMRATRDHQRRGEYRLFSKENLMRKYYDNTTLVEGIIKQKESDGLVQQHPEVPDMKMYLCWDSTSESAVQNISQSLEISKTAQIENTAAKEFMCDAGSMMPNKFQMRMDLASTAASASGEVPGEKPLPQGPRAGRPRPSDTTSTKPPGKGVPKAKTPEQEAKAALAKASTFILEIKSWDAVLTQAGVPEAMKNAALADVKKHLDLLTGSRDALEVNMAHAIKGEKLMEATQSLVTLIANYQNHAKSVKSLLPKQPSAKAKAKAAAKAASVAKGVGDAA